MILKLVLQQKYSRVFPQSVNCSSCVFTVYEIERGNLWRQIKTLDLVRDDFIGKVLSYMTSSIDAHRAISQALLKIQTVYLIRCPPGGIGTGIYQNTDQPRIRSVLLLCFTRRG